MSLPLRSLATILFAVAATTCADGARTGAPSPTQPSKGGTARIGFDPVFSKSARAAAATIADFGITFDHVRVVIVRPVADTVVDTLVVFAPGQADLTLDLTVPSHADGETFNADIDYTNPSGVVFHGEGTVQSHAPDQPAPAQQITVNYTGPGANVSRIVVAPKTATIGSPGSQAFTVTAFDANNAPVTVPPINWSVSDATLGAVSSSGVFTTAGKRGTVTVTAVSVTGATDNGSATISLPPSGISLVSGGGQSGKVGTTLTSPAVVRVFASDGVGVPGISVNFAAAAGGKVGAAFVTTDASGSASSSLTLGPAVGAQSFAAVASGFSVAIPATATVGDAAAIAVVSGDGQSDTVSRGLKQPFVVKVTDTFGNALSGVTVTWARTSGGGAPASPTSVTAADGTSSMSYTLGPVLGIETVTATVAGVTKAATFSATALAGPASGLAIVSGDAQAASIGATLAPFVLKVTDANGNVVKGATVTWVATNGTLAAATTTTDASGVTSNTMTLGTVTGSASAVASVGPRAIAFGATVRTGIVSKAVFLTSPPSTASAGVAITPPVQVALQDAGGNLTPATNSVTIAIGTNPSGGTLTGTLTKSAVAGIATFDDLKINKAGAGFTLVATSAGTAGATTPTFGIVAGSPSGLSIVAGNGQTATVNTAVPIPPSVRLADASGNPIAGVPVSFTPSSGSGAVVPSASVLTDATGTATLTSWTLGTVAGTQTMTATAAGVPTVTFTAAATAGAPTHLLVVASPTTQTAGGNSIVTAQLLDAFNNTVPSSGHTINWTSTGSGTFASLSNTTTASGITPPMNFTTSTIAGVTHTITATDAGAPTVNGIASVTTVAGPAALIAFTTAPSVTAQAGINFPTQPVLQLEDINGNFVAQSGVSIAAAVSSGGGSLGGTTTIATDVTGRASFTTLKLDGTVGTRTLGFTSSGLAGATSGAIALTFGTPSALIYFVNPSSTTAGTAISPSIVVKIRDLDNNDVTSATNTVALSITPGTGAASATLGGTTSLAASGGAATFTTINITSASSTAYTLRATSAGLSTATSVGFLISPAAPASLTIVSGNDQYFPNNGSVTMASQIVSVKDAFSNPINGASVTFTASTGATISGGGSSLVVATNPSGQAAASTAITASTGTAVTTVTIGSLTPVTFNSTRVNQGNWDTQCRLGSAGAAYCWADGSYGSIGNGGTSFATTPATVSGGITFTSLMDGYGSHECGLTSAGVAYCWGRNTFGEVGDNTTTDRAAPVAVGGGHTFIQLTSASYTTCGLTAGGQVYCWGWAGQGLYGDGSVGTIHTLPTLVAAAGKLYSKITVLDDFACGIETGGALSCWGQTPTGTSVTPSVVAGAPALVSITSGFYHVCGLTAAGAGYCFGQNSSGQLGDGTTTPRSAPVLIMSSLITIHAYAYNTCAITTTNAMYCWGDELFGNKIGDGRSSGNALSPAAVSGGISFASIMGGSISFTCANDTLGNPYCWGGTTGSASPTSSTTPVLVDWPEGFFGIGGVRRRP